MARSAGAFGLFLGVYNGITCLSENFRGKKDLNNHLVGGMVAGGLSALGSRSPRTILTTALGTGMITGFVAAVSPKEQR